MTPQGIVFLVDDDENIHDALDELLSSGGWLVVTAADAAEALALMRQCVHPAVAVIGMRGRHLIAHMKTDPKLAALPIVVISGEIPPEPIPGVARVLDKSCELPALLGVLDAIEIPPSEAAISSGALEV